MSEINWFVVLVGVVVMGGSLVYLMMPPTKQRSSASAAAAPAPAKLQAKKELAAYTLEEVARHKSRADCWIVVDNFVYDVTSYIDEHPGGDSILANAGGDSTAGVHGPQHPPSMWDVLALYKIGVLVK